MKSTRPIRILSVALSLLMVIGIVSISRDTVLAATTDPTTGLTYAISSGKATVTGFTAPSGFSGALIIPATLGGYPVTSIEAAAFLECQSLLNVTIPNGVTSIGYSAFDRCEALTSVSISSTVTNISGIPFAGCHSLITIEVSTENTTYKSTDGILYSRDGTELIGYPGGKSGSFAIPSSVTILTEGAFWRCTGLSSITIPNSVTNIGSQTFLGCIGLSSITIPNSVTNIGSEAFSECTGLTSITIPSSVINIGSETFADCHNLLMIEVDRGNTSYKSIDGILYSQDGTELICCPGGKSGSITIPNSVTNIGDDAFYDCTGLTSITIPSSVTSIGSGAFLGCAGLTGITIPNSVSVIESYTFFGCNGLTSVAIPESVTSIKGSAFSACDSLLTITVNTENTNFKSIDGILYSKDGTKIISCPGGKIGSITIPRSVTIIGSDAFYGCTGLTSITIDSNVTSIETTAFGACTGLTSIMIPRSMTSINSSAFISCTNLSKAYFFGNAPTMGFWAFDACASDFTVYYLSGKTGFADLWFGHPAESFVSVTDALTGLIFSIEEGKATITGFSAPSGFSGALTITSSIGGLPVTGIASDAFANGSALTSVSIPSSVTTIGTDAFSGCLQLTAINVDAANTAYKSVDGILYSKDGTILLRYPAGKTGTVSIPSSVTSIGTYAFASCSGLTGISIPENVTSIGDGAFSNCSNLSSAYFSGNAPSMGTGVFAGSASGFTIRYVSTATGFTNPWYGYPTVLFSTASVSYQTHVQDIGWQDYVSNGAVSGTSAQSKRLEGIRIKLALEGISGGIEYRTHVQDIGWQDWVADNTLSGTSGQSKRLEAIQIRLTGEAADVYDVYYRVHAQNTGWMDWAKNGVSSGTAGYSYRLEAIEVKLVLKSEVAPGPTTRPFIDLNDMEKVSYKTHVQDVGWQAYVSNGEMSGTSAQSKRLEGIQIKLENIAGGIEYSTHIQDIGWQDFVANDAMSGTSGQSKRLEAIKIRLTGAAADAYDIYYCVHAQNTGWLDWAKNGESAGTAGFGYRLEAIKIVLVPKGGPAPGATTRAFVQG